MKKSIYSVYLTAVILTLFSCHTQNTPPGIYGNRIYTFQLGSKTPQSELYLEKCSKINLSTNQNLMLLPFQSNSADSLDRIIADIEINDCVSYNRNETKLVQTKSKVESIKSPDKIKNSIPKIALQNARKMASFAPTNLKQAKKFPKEFKKNVKEMKATFLDYEGPNNFVTYGLYAILAGLTLFLLGILLFFIFTGGTMRTTNPAIGFLFGILGAAGIFLFVVGCLMWLLGWMAYGLGIY
jgi:hypothetical protein